MKYIKGFFHSIYFSYIGWFGGKVQGGTYYLLWTIHLNGNRPSQWVDIHSHCIGGQAHCFYYHLPKDSTVFKVIFKNSNIYTRGNKHE